MSLFDIIILKMKSKNNLQVQWCQKKLMPALLDIKITLQTKLGTSTNQLLQKIDITGCMTESYEGIVLAKLMGLLERDCNIPIENREISFYYEEGEVFVNCGINPINQQVKIQSKELQVDGCLHIKIKETGLLKIQRLMLAQTITTNKQQDDHLDQIPPTFNKNKCRRTKQRRIGYIIDKVIEWRKYYAGTTQINYQHQKYSLKQAAMKVGISKKSLDDYLSQIRFGYRFGFNFNQHYNQKAGILRDFVRQHKKLINKVDIKGRRTKDKEYDNQDN